MPPALERVIRIHSTGLRTTGLYLVYLGMTGGTVITTGYFVQKCAGIGPGRHARPWFCGSNIMGIKNDQGVRSRCGPWRLMIFSRYNLGTRGKRLHYRRPAPHVGYSATIVQELAATVYDNQINARSGSMAASYQGSYKAAREGTRLFAV